MSLTKVATLILAGYLALGSTVVAETVDNTDVSVESEIKEVQEERAYKYGENDGIFVFYETENESLYRELLPDEFDMPEKMMVHLFVMDFYEIKSDADPYKEMSISLLASYNGEEVWHCVYMPVTSQHSMVAGIKGLGLPKSIGEVDLSREDEVYTGTITDKYDRVGSISIDTNDYEMTLEEENEIKEYMSYPKLNILDGEVIQMTRAGGQVNIIDVSNRYPYLVKVNGGEATISFDSLENSKPHPFDLEPSSILAAYYLKNKIPFSLDRK